MKRTKGLKIRPPPGLGSRIHISMDNVDDGWVIREKQTNDRDRQQLQAYTSQRDNSDISQLGAKLPSMGEKLDYLGYPIGHDRTSLLRRLRVNHSDPAEIVEEAYQLVQQYVFMDSPSVSIQERKKFFREFVHSIVSELEDKPQNEYRPKSSVIFDFATLNLYHLTEEQIIGLKYGFIIPPLETEDHPSKNNGPEDTIDTLALYQKEQDLRVQKRVKTYVASDRHNETNHHWKRNINSAEKVHWHYEPNEMGKPVPKQEYEDLHLGSEWLPLESDTMGLGPDIPYTKEPHHPVETGLNVKFRGRVYSVAKSLEATLDAAKFASDYSMGDVYRTSEETDSILTGLASLIEGVGRENTELLLMLQGFEGIPHLAEEYSSLQVGDNMVLIPKEDAPRIVFNIGAIRLGSRLGPKSVEGMGFQPVRVESYTLEELGRQPVDGGVTLLYKTPTMKPV